MFTLSIALVKFKGLLGTVPYHLGFKVFRRLRRTFQRVKDQLQGTNLSAAAFRRSLRPEYSGAGDLLASFGEARAEKFFIHSNQRKEIIDSLLQAYPDARTNIIRSADLACEHVFDLLGSGPTRLGEQIDWHADFKNGYRWNPKTYYQDIRPAPYPGGYDLKVPWELSRCQHFAWMGQAYWITGDEKYAREFRAEVEDWIRQNPPEFGVNWVCSMDIAIRAVNWLWGYAFFQSSLELNDDFRLEFSKSLLCHGRHILANLERTITFAGNHYLSDLVGLIYLGILMPEFKEAAKWRDFGLKELEEEMFKQVYPDGGNFEASTNYHRLATELFLSATLLARLNGYEFSGAYMLRLEKMLDFIYHLTKPDGTIPVIGDQDNGRLHRLKVWADPSREWKDFRPHLAVGCVLFNRPEWGKSAAEHWEEAFWFYGRETLTAFHRSLNILWSEHNSMEFSNTGVYIMRADDIYLAVDLGPVGQNGRGGHAHNDSASFELYSSGQTWIQDPGTYLYTSDYDARNSFRSTAFHNTLALPGYEQNDFTHLNLFEMRSESSSYVLSWQAVPGSDTHLAGEIQWMLYPRVTHRRSFYLYKDSRAVLIKDQFYHANSTGLLFFHFAPDLEIELVDEPYIGLCMTSSDGRTAWLYTVLSSTVKLHLTNGWLSESYGNRVPGKVASLELPSGLEHKTLLLLPGDSDISRRIDIVLHN